MKLTEYGYWTEYSLTIESIPQYRWACSRYDGPFYLKGIVDRETILKLHVGRSLFAQFIIHHGKERHAPS